MNGRLDAAGSVFVRELRVLVRTRSAIVAGTILVGLVAGIAWFGDARGYVPLVLLLLTPLELIAPVVVAGVGYRSILKDRQRGELTVMRTYPLPTTSYVCGVYLARLAVLGVLTFVALLLAGCAVAFAPAETPIPSQLGFDSPLLYFRFISLTIGYVAVLLGVVVAISALVRTRHRGIAGALAGAVVVGIGLDLAIVAGIASDLLQTTRWVTVLTPTTAYSGLVTSLVVDPVVVAGVEGGSPLVYALGLGAWLGGSIIVTVLGTREYQG